MTTRVELGTSCWTSCRGKKLEPVRAAMAWALGRVGARVPVYGPLNTVVPAETAAVWLTSCSTPPTRHAMEQLAVMQLARRTDDRYRDVPDKLRDKVIAWLDRAAAPPHFTDLVRRRGTLDAEEQGMIFGEALPRGLRLEG